MIQFMLHNEVQRKFTTGDKVIQVKNDYDIDVMNGTIGTVQDVIDGSYVIDFYEEGAHRIKGEKINNLQLAYAITVHKAQGSEFPCVVFVCHKSHHYFTDRNLMYTAVTRASKTSIILGDKWGIRKIAERNNVPKRRTFLNLLAEG